MSFIETISKKSKIGMFAAIAATFFVLTSCGNNAPVNTNKAPESIYTYGSIVNEMVTVPAGKYVVFDINLNRKAALKGRYHSENYDANVGMFVIDEQNFEKFKAGEDFKHVLSAGNTPGGQTQRTLEPGVYKIVIDNRHETEKDVNVVCNFEVDKP